MPSTITNVSNSRENMPLHRFSYVPLLSDIPAFLTIWPKRSSSGVTRTVLIPVVKLVFFLPWDSACMDTQSAFKPSS